MILTGGSSSGVYKEKTGSLHKLGYELDENTRDYDGYVDGGQVEVKSESYVYQKQARRKKHVMVLLERRNGGEQKQISLVKMTCYV